MIEYIRQCRWRRQPEVNLSDKNKKSIDSLDLSVVDKENFLRTKPLYKWLLVSLLFVLALGIRVYRINDPPLEFNSSRQYQCALLARYYYHMSDQSTPDWQRQLAWAQKPPNYEPPLMEKLASLFFKIRGGESLWFPRLLSVVFWLVAGAGLYLLSKKLWTETAAVFSITLFLFLPFGIFASRSFLPDPLMVMLMVFAFLAIVSYFEKPTFLRVTIAAILSAAAIFVKPMSVFMIFFSFVFLMISQKKVRHYLGHSHLWIFILTSLAPGAIYYSYGLFITKSLQSQASWSFIPRLLLSPMFYRGWLQNVGLVVGFSLLLITILAIPLAYPKKTPRAFLAGLWVGYLVFSFVFNYHTSTHHYYHLQLIPLAALSVGYVGALVFARLNNTRIHWKIRATILTILLLAFALDGMKQMIIRRHWLENNMDFTRVVEVAKEIGQVVNHSKNCIFLDPEYGSTLKYHGWLAGWIWYSAADISIRRRFRGWDESNAGELYFRKYALNQPDFFIVTDFKEFDRQKDLQEFLKSTFPVVASTPRYLIFDMTRMRE